MSAKEPKPQPSILSVIREAARLKAQAVQRVRADVEEVMHNAGYDLVDSHLFIEADYFQVKHNGETFLIKITPTQESFDHWIIQAREALS